MSRIWKDGGHLSLNATTKITTLLLEDIAREISRCRRCDNDGLSVVHLAPLVRGTGNQILVVGVQPGRTEVETGRAFSGAAGRRLIEWLVSADAGRNDAEIFQRCYFTSLCKCVVSKGDFRRAAQNCFPFLQRQIQLVGPRICVTLGIEPLYHLFGYAGSIFDVVGRTWTEQELSGSLLAILPPACIVLPLPHPSPANASLNTPTNQGRLHAALQALRDAL